MNDKNIMSKILVCLYVIIALLVINTLVLIISNGSAASSSNNGTNTEESGEYDVSMFDTISMEDFKEVSESEDLQVVYIGRSTCGYCVAFLPTLQQAQKEYGYTTKYLDITTMSSEDQEEILTYDNDDEFLSENFGSTPMVLIMKDGKLVDGWVGYTEYDSFAEFLEKNGITK